MMFILACLTWLCLDAGAEPEVVLRAARMLDVEQGIIVQNPLIVIEGGLIRSVSTGAPSPDAEVIDLGDVTLLPGLIDCHTHHRCYVQSGMTEIEAIRTATLNAADLLGVDDRGAIEAGMLADIIAVKGNPLEDIRTLESVMFVMKDGVVYKEP